jgi:Rieske Fe-S protein
MSEPIAPAESTPDANACGEVPAAVLERRAVLRVAGMAGAVGVGLAACSSSGRSGASGVATPAAAVASQPDSATVSALGTPDSVGGSASGAPGAASESALGTPDSVGGSASGPSLGAASRIPVGGGAIFTAEKVVITQPTAGSFKAFSSTCTHLGCQVNEVSGGLIVCPCHGSEFSIADGSVQGGPALQSLPSRDVTVRDGQLFLSS